MYSIYATYKGLVPMMMDRFPDPTVTDGPAKKKAKGYNKDEVASKCYMDKKGVYVPSDNIRMMLIGNKLRRGAAQIFGSDIESNKGTKYRSLCEGTIWVVGLSDPLKIYIEPKRKIYDECDARSFVNSQGSRSMSYRPIIKTPWSLSFIIQITDDNIDQSFVRQLFDVAGLRCGVCAYGPKFGRCVIDKWEVKK